jgi:hypothetical protein
MSSAVHRTSPPSDISPDRAVTELRSGEASTLLRRSKGGNRARCRAGHLADVGHHRIDPAYAAIFI